MIDIIHTYRDTFGEQKDTHAVTITKMEEIIRPAREQMACGIKEYQKQKRSRFFNKNLPRLGFTLNIHEVLGWDMDSLPCHDDFYRDELLVLSEDKIKLVFGGYLSEYVTGSTYSNIRFEVLQMLDPETVKYTGFRIDGQFVQWGF